MTSTAPSTGLVYYLPVRTLATDAKFVILDCGVKQGKAELLYDVKPTVTAAVAADRTRAFTIADGLDGKVLKAMNFEISQYENGTLKGVNVTADDRTAETATNILSGALKFGLALTGGGLFSIAETEEETVWLRNLDEKADVGKISAARAACGDTTTDALLRVHKLTRALSGAREATEAKSKLTAAVTEAEKAVVEARATLKAANEAGGAEDVALAKTTLATAVGKLAEARKKAENAGDATAATAINQDIAATVQRYLTYNASRLVIPTETERPASWPIQYSVEDLKAAGIRHANMPLEAQIVLETLSATRTATDSIEAVNQVFTDGRADGIWFRSPASAQLRICVKACGESGITDRFSQVITVPQWGQLTRLPLRNMAFAKNTTKLSFAPDGTLLSLSGDSTASAERAGGAFLQSGESFLDFATKRRALLSELAAADSAAEKAQIQQQLDLLALNQQLAAAGSPIGPEREAQLATLKYQIQQKEDEIKLLELEKKKRLLEAEPR